MYQLIRLSWTEFKAFLAARNAEFSHVATSEHYFLRSKSGLFSVDCEINRNPADTAELDEFEDDYLSLSKTSIHEESIKPLLARTYAATVTGVATAYLPLPNANRTITGGQARFDNAVPGDYVLADIYDLDNVLGGGAVVISSWVDLDLASDYQGWYMMGQEGVHLQPLVTNDPIDLIGSQVAGLYLRVRGYKANPLLSDTLRVNVHWGHRVR